MVLILAVLWDQVTLKPRGQNEAANVTFLLGTCQTREAFRDQVCY